MRQLLAVLALGAVLVACSEQATSPQSRATAIAADFTNNPDGGDPVVARYEFDNYYVAWNNAPTNTVRAYHTTFPLSAVLGSAWDDAACGPANPTPGLHLQEVAHWDHADPLSIWIENGIADVWIVLVDRTGSGPCNTRPVTASGWGKLHYTDNNSTAAWGGHAPGIQDTWTFRAEGSLTTPAGARVQYNGLMHCVVPLPFNDIRCTYRINF